MTGLGSTALSIERLSSLETARDEWLRLADLNGNVFGTYEWASAWWKHLGSGAELALGACIRADGSTAAILPLAIETESRARVVRWIGHGPSDRLAPICSPDERAAVAEALIAHLRATGGDLFIGDQMPAEEGWGAALGAQTLERESSPTVRIENLDWETYMAQRSANFRKQVRSRERRLDRQGELRFRLTEDAGDFARDFERMVELHEARWADGSSVAFTGPRLELHREFAGAALARGWLRLWTLELDGRPLATWYGFRYGGADWYYQGGRLPEASADRVGFVLTAYTLREAMAEGLREYRFLRGGEEFKSRFADYDPGLETIALPLTTRGRATLAAMRLRPAAGRALRRLRLR